MREIYIIEHLPEILDGGAKSGWKSNFHTNGMEATGHIINADTDDAVMYVTTEFEDMHGNPWEVIIDLKAGKTYKPKAYSFVSSNETQRWKNRQENMARDVPHPNPERILIKDGLPESFGALQLFVADIKLKRKYESHGWTRVTRAV